MLNCHYLSNMLLYITCFLRRLGAVPNAKQVQTIHVSEAIANKYKIENQTTETFIIKQQLNR
mgnify:CR=1 FL=1